jgi:hypothetical protein
MTEQEMDMRSRKFYSIAFPIVIAVIIILTIILFTTGLIEIL